MGVREYSLNADVLIRIHLWLNEILRCYFQCQDCTFSYSLNILQNFKTNEIFRDV